MNDNEKLQNELFKAVSKFMNLTRKEFKNLTKEDMDKIRNEYNMIA